MEPASAAENSEKDRPLREDIRLLGRILGDTVSQQEGEAAFAIVERIRQSSVRFHREDDETARQELAATLNSLSRDQTTRVIRSFSYFSHLANIAEDQHHIRRTRAHAMAASAPREGSMAHALIRARDSGISRLQLQAFFDSILISPVLTAHPTEVRRKSTIDREMEIERIGAVAAPDLDQIAKSLGRHQSGLGTVALKQRVDDQRGAMADQRHIARRNFRLGEARQNAFDEIAVGSRTLGISDRAGLMIERNQIGKSAADIDGNGVRHSSPLYFYGARE